MIVSWLCVVMFSLLKWHTLAWSWTSISGDGINEPITMDILRAVKKSDGWAKKLMNCNAANTAGVLGYLHTEVIPKDMVTSDCHRHYQIDSIAIHQVKIFNPPGQRPFGPFLAFDQGKCTVPNCDEILKQKGYYIGIQSEASNPRHAYHNHSFWYSFPELGLCKEPNGTKNCTYSYKYKGNIDVNEISSISNFHDFCENGGIEFQRKGRDPPDCCTTVKSLPLWKDPCDETLCNNRVQFMDTVVANYPSTCNIKYDTNYFGSDLKSAGLVSTALACCYLCSDEPKCKYWTWNGPGDTLECFLKLSNNDTRSQKGVTSGSCQTVTPTPPPPPPTPHPPTPHPPTPPPTPIPPKNCTVEENINYNGYDIRSVGKVDSSSVCCEFCTVDPDCRYWTWNGPGDTLECFLKSKSDGRVSEKGKTSGSSQNPPPPTPPPTPPIPPPKNCTVQHNINFYGNDIREAGIVKTAFTCCKSCTAEPKCFYWTWNGPGDTLMCYLKSSNNDTRSQTGITSGSSQNLPPPPSPIPTSSAC